MCDSIIFTDINAAPGFGRYGGAYKIASEIRANGYSCQVIEFFSELTLDDINKIFDRFLDSETKIVGFSTTLWVQNPDNAVDLWTKEKRPIRFVVADLNRSLFPHKKSFMKEIFCEIKRRNTKTSIVIGGQKTKKKEFYDQYPEVDYWVTGQGETSIMEIIRSNRIITNRIMSDNIFPYNNFVHSTTKWTAQDIIMPGEHLPLEVARGCIFKCAFCAFDLNGKRPGEYIKSPELLRDEILYNYENFGTTGYMISDDTLNDSPDKIEALHRMITDLPFEFVFSSYLRLDLIHTYPQMITLLREMGIRSCQLGIESLNHETGRAIGKGLHPSLQKNTLHKMKEEWQNEVFIGGGFIIGLPKETPTTCSEWLSWLDQDDTPLDSCQVVPLVVTKDSKIGEDPDAWSYGKDITPEQARKITMDFYNGGHIRKRNLTSFHFYSRFRNVGYSHRECGHIYMHDTNKILESETRRLALKENYFARLFAAS